MGAAQPIAVFERTRRVRSNRLFTPGRGNTKEKITGCCDGLRNAPPILSFMRCMVSHELINNSSYFHPQGRPSKGWLHFTDRPKLNDYNIFD
jgi:hypothetical protein